MSLITTLFGFHSTAADVIRGINLAGKRAVITGGAAGIGVETARVLASAGASVTLAVRRPAQASPVVEELRRKTVDQGAATSVLLATSPLLQDVSGRYFEDCNEAPRIARRPTDFSGGVAPYAVDPANAERLWDLASRLIA